MNKRILQFDDDEMMLQMYGAKLKEAGFEYVSRLNPSEDPISDVLSVNPDLIIMDIIMPGMDGFAAVKILKSNPQTKDIPIFFNTNMGQQEDIQKGIDLGANDYIVTANYTPTQFVEKIKEYLNNPESYRPLYKGLPKNE